MRRTAAVYTCLYMRTHRAAGGNLLGELIQITGKAQRRRQYKRYKSFPGKFFHIEIITHSAAFINCFSVYRSVPPLISGRFHNLSVY